MLSRAVDYPVDGEGLRNLAAKCRTAVIVVPDATRRASLPGVLPVILSRWLAAGIRADCITVLVACGTHPPAPRGEVATLLGELPLGVRIRQHSSRDIAALVEVGEIRPGVPLRLDREAVETDLLVTVGAVRHHYFAGFGGGPKMVFPGIAGHDEIQANHSLVLHRPTTGSNATPVASPVSSLAIRWRRRSPGRRISGRPISPSVWFRGEMAGSPGSARVLGERHSRWRWRGFASGTNSQPGAFNTSWHVVAAGQATRP